MSDAGKKETLSLTKEPRPLGLRPIVESAQVKQNFSHGRSKTVQVEVRKKRAAPRAAATAAENEVFATPEASPTPTPPPAPVVEVESEAELRGRVVLPTLSEAEKATRARALEDAQRADVEARHLAEESARLRQMEDQRSLAEREAAEIRRKSEEERKRVDEEARRHAEGEAERKLREQEARERGEVLPSTEGTQTPIAVPRPADRAALEAEAEQSGAARRPGRRTPSTRRAEPRRRAGRLTIARALNVGEDDERVQPGLGQTRTRAPASAQGRTRRQRRDPA